MMDKDEALQRVENSVAAVVELTWKLFENQTFAPEVRTMLTSVAAYYLDILLTADPVRATMFVQNLAEKRIEAQADAVVSEFERLLKNGE
jgi:hypothetical protein